MQNSDISDEAARLAREQEITAEADANLRFSAPVVYEIVRAEGEEELARPNIALWWSGVAAGLSIGFSVLAEAMFHTKLPDTAWRPLIENFGYCVGFLIVVLGRQQLFTENTITAVLPALAERSRACFLGTARLWGIVFAANMVGAFVFAFACMKLNLVAPDLRDGMLSLSHHMMELDQSQMFLRGIFAGWLIAAMVWMLPSAENSQFAVIVMVTYLIALGDFTHIIAGSVEAFSLVLVGDLSVLGMITQFSIPVFLGNVIGGTALFAMLAYAQVRVEIPQSS